MTESLYLINPRSESASYFGAEVYDEYAQLIDFSTQVRCLYEGGDFWQDDVPDEAPLSRWAGVPIVADPLILA